MVKLNHIMFDRLVPEDREVVLSAVENHNKLRVADTLNPEEQFFAELLRNADKINIWRVVLAHYTSEDGDGLDSIELGLPDLPEVSDDICRNLLAGNMVTATRMSSLNDFKLLQMGWVYDLNFRRSFEIIREREYIRKIYETMPQTARIAEMSGMVRPLKHDRFCAKSNRRSRTMSLTSVFSAVCVSMCPVFRNKSQTET